MDSGVVDGIKTLPVDEGVTNMYKYGYGYVK